MAVSGARNVTKEGPAHAVQTDVAAAGKKKSAMLRHGCQGDASARRRAPEERARSFADGERERLARRLRGQREGRRGRIGSENHRSRLSVLRWWCDKSGRQGRTSAARLPTRARGEAKSFLQSAPASHILTLSSFRSRHRVRAASRSCLAQTRDGVGGAWHLTPFQSARR